MPPQKLASHIHEITWIILGMGLAYESRRYIGWAHIKNISLYIHKG